MCLQKHTHRARIYYFEMNAVKITEETYLCNTLFKSYSAGQVPPADKFECELGILVHHSEEDDMVSAMFMIVAAVVLMGATAILAVAAWTAATAATAATAVVAGIVSFFVASAAKDDLRYSLRVRRRAQKDRTERLQALGLTEEDARNV